jgi:hypothetical protein
VSNAAILLTALSALSWLFLVELGIGVYQLVNVGLMV